MDNFSALNCGDVVVFTIVVAHPETAQLPILVESGGWVLTLTRASDAGDLGLAVPVVTSPPPPPPPAVAIPAVAIPEHAKQETELQLMTPPDTPEFQRMQQQQKKTVTARIPAAPGELACPKPVRGGGVCGATATTTYEGMQYCSGCAKNLRAARARQLKKAQAAAGSVTEAADEAVVAVKGPAGDLLRSSGGSDKLQQTIDKFAKSGSSLTATMQPPPPLPAAASETKTSRLAVQIPGHSNAATVFGIDMNPISDSDSRHFVLMFDAAAVNDPKRKKVVGTVNAEQYSRLSMISDKQKRTLAPGSITFNPHDEELVNTRYSGDLCMMPLVDHKSTAAAAATPVFAAADEEAPMPIKQRAKRAAAAAAEKLARREEEQRHKRSRFIDDAAKVAGSDEEEEEEDNDYESESETDSGGSGSSSSSSGEESDEEYNNEKRKPAAGKKKSAAAAPHKENSHRLDDSDDDE